MRFHIQFELKRPELPLRYREVIISYYKRALSEHQGGMFFEDFYAPGKQKPMCWAAKLSQPKFDEGTIYLEKDQLEITLTTPEHRTALIFFNALMDSKGKAMPIPDGNVLTMKNIRMIREKSIQKNTVLFKFHSPLCVREHDRESNTDIYFYPERKGFREALVQNLIRNCPEHFSKEIEELKMDASKLKKVVISIFGQKIDASIGEIVLMGNPELLNHFYQAGMGSKRSSGFGLLELLDQWGLEAAI